MSTSPDSPYGAPDPFGRPGRPPDEPVRPDPAGGGAYQGPADGYGPADPGYGSGPGAAEDSSSWFSPGPRNHDQASQGGYPQPQPGPGYADGPGPAGQPLPRRDRGQGPGGYDAPPPDPRYGRAEYSDPGYTAGPGYSDPGYSDPGYGRQDYGGQGYAPQDYAQQDYRRQDYGGQQNAGRRHGPPEPGAYREHPSGPYQSPPPEAPPGPPPGPRREAPPGPPFPGSGASFPGSGAPPTRAERRPQFGRAEPEQAGFPQPGPGQSGFPRPAADVPGAAPPRYEDVPRYDSVPGYDNSPGYDDAPEPRRPHRGARRIPGSVTRILVGGAVVIVIGAGIGIGYSALRGSKGDDPGCKAYTATALPAYNQTVKDLDARAQQATLTTDLTTAANDLASAAGQAKSGLVQSALSGLRTQVTAMNQDVKKGSIPSSAVTALNNASAAADSAC